MAQDATNVRIAKTGAVYVAPYGTALPTTTAGSLNAAFVDLGYVTTDGVTFTPSQNVTAIRAWQNNARVRTVFTEKDYTFKFVLMEDKGEVAKLWYAASAINVGGAAEWNATPDSATTTIFSFVVDAVDGSTLKRFVIPQGEITERGEQVYSGEDAIGYDATVTCYYDSTLGAPFKAYSNSTAWGYS